MGQFVGRIGSVDEDLLDSQKRTYQVVSGDWCKLTAGTSGTGTRSTVASCSTFRLENDGNLYVNKDSHKVLADDDNHLVINQYLKVGENYELMVKVTDEKGATQSQKVTITTFEQNDPPSMGDRTIRAPENSHISVQGRTVGNPITGTDADGDVLSYSIVGGNVANAFKIDAVTAQIYVNTASALDFEVRQEWELKVQAKDNGKGELTDICTVRIQLTDVNEYPTIDAQWFTIKENSLRDTNVGKPVQSNDVDANNWGVVRYYIVGGNVGNRFKIHSVSGQITVQTENFDFELRASYILTVRVVDTVGSGLSKENAMTINLIDMNDAPLLERYLAPRTIEENSRPGSMIGTKLRTSDQDAYDSLSYKLTGANCWSKEITGGNSASHYFTPTVTPAKDGSVSATFDIKAARSAIIVLSERKNPSDRYEIQVGVGSKRGVRAWIYVANKRHTMRCSNKWITLLKKFGTRVDWASVWVKASKKGVLEIGVGSQVGKGSKATCTIPTGNGFSNKQNGYCVKSNGRDQNSGVYKLRGGNYNSRSKQKECLARCRAVNGYTGCEMIWSQGNRGCYVHTRQVTRGNGVGRHSCYIKGGVPQVSASSVKVETVGVGARDGVAAEFSSVCYATRLFDGRNAIGEPVNTPADASGIFNVDKETGQIYLTSVAKDAQLDFESENQFSIELTVTDDGIPSRSTKTTVAIQVLNVNEVSVVQSAAIKCSGFHACMVVNENAPVGTSIGKRMYSKEQDLGQLAPIGTKRSDLVTQTANKWSISGGNWNDRFRIDENSGQIYVNKNVRHTKRQGDGVIVDIGSSLLNHEDTYVITEDGAKVNGAGRPVFHLTVTSTDSKGLEGDGMVEVAINDVNEPPVMLEMMRSVREDVTQNGIVGIPVISIDEDDVSQPFGTQAYSIEKVQWTTFNYMLHTTTSSCGVHDCSLVGPFGGENAMPTLTCGAVSSTSIKKGRRIVISKGTSTSSVEVKQVVSTSPLVLRLVNDFEASDRVKGLGETEGFTGWKAMCASWNDGSSSDVSMFKISQKTGQITVAKPNLANHESDHNLFRLTVTAADNGASRGNTGRTEVVIRIVDVNERPTVYDATFDLNENSVSDTKVGKPIVATDPDKYSRQKLRYTITAGNSDRIFMISDCDGQITIDKDSWTPSKDKGKTGPTLNYEVRNQYVLEVTVTDDGLPVQLSDTAKVTINIVDVNESPSLVVPRLKMQVGERALRKPGKSAPKVTQWQSTAGQKLLTLNEDAFTSPNVVRVATNDPVAMVIKKLPKQLIGVDSILLRRSLPMSAGINAIQFTAKAGVTVFALVDPSTAQCTEATKCCAPDAGNTVCATASTCDSACPLDDGWESATSRATVSIGERGDVIMDIYRKNYPKAADASNNDVSIDMSNGPSDQNKYTIAFIVTPLTEKIDMSLCMQDVGIRKTDGKGPMRTNMLSNVANSLFPKDSGRLTDVWTMGGDKGDATMANGINYFELDLGNEYAVRGIKSRGGEARGDNLAKGKIGSSTSDRVYRKGTTDASKALDGSHGTGWQSCFISSATDNSANPWFRVDLVNPHPIGLVRILRRNDGCGNHCKNRLTDFEVLVTNQADIANANVNEDRCTGTLRSKKDFGGDNWANIDCGKKGIQGRYVFIRLTGKQADGTYLPGNMGANQQYLTLCEVEVYSSSSYVGVTKYSLQRSLDGKRFIPIKADQLIEVFQGNYDRSSDVESELSFPATARYIRVIPLQCNGACAGNFEVVGGPVEKCQVIDNIALTGDEIVGYDQDGKTNQKWADLTYRVTGGDTDGIFCFPDPSVPALYVCDSEGLNYEKAGKISLTVSVFDAGAPRLSNTGTVAVTVLDLNEAPELEPVTVKIHENAIAKTKVSAPIIGTDPDDGDVLTYTITADDSFGKLALHLRSGVIYVTDKGGCKKSDAGVYAHCEPLNFEMEPLYNFTVRVTDQNGLWSENDVRVSIIDVNEPPTITDQSRNVLENPEPLSLVGAPLPSFDIDSGPNGEVGYSIDSQELCPVGKTCQALAEPIFGIDRSTGQLLVVRSRNADGTPTLNYEADLENGTTVHRLVVRVTDMGWLYDTAVVMLTTVDANESPFFYDVAGSDKVLTTHIREQMKVTTTMLLTEDDGITRKIRGGTISENTAVDTWVGDIIADDIDAGDSLTYRISAGNSAGLFGITKDDTTGVATIRTLRDFIDHEDKDFHVLTIEARDADAKPLIGTTTFRVNILDVNEAPSFKSTFSGFVLENAKSGQAIGGPINAYDVDYVVTKSTIDFWSDTINGGKSVSTNTCMMQWGAEPFSRASKATKMTDPLGNAKTLGWVSDITKSVSLKSSTGAYMAATNSKPTGEKLLAQSYAANGCYKHGTQKSVWEEVAGFDREAGSNTIILGSANKYCSYTKSDYLVNYHNNSGVTWNEIACKQSCIEDAKCNFVTFFDPQHGESGHCWHHETCGINNGADASDFTTVSGRTIFVWKVTQKSNSPLRSLENDAEVLGVLTIRPTERLNPIEMCASAAKIKGYTVFGITDGGECLGHAGITADQAKASGAATTCSMGRGNVDVFDLYVLVELPKAPSSCSEIKNADASSKSGMYRLFSGELNFCDMSTDGGGWTMVAYGPKGMVGDLRTGSVSDQSVDKSGAAWINPNAVTLVNNGKEIAYAWTTKTKVNGGINSFESAVRFTKPTGQTMDLDAGAITTGLNAGKKCNDPAVWTRVDDVTCITGDNCGVPRSMFTQKNSLGATYGASYGLVAPASVEVVSYAPAAKATTQIDSLYEGVLYASNRGAANIKKFNKNKYSGAVFLRGDNDKTTSEMNLKLNRPATVYIAISNKPDFDESISGTNEAGYRGGQTKTVSGKTCQKWTSQTPHAHSRTDTNYPGKGIGEHNYCRNPDNEPEGIWCYTTDAGSRWEYCDPAAEVGSADDRVPVGFVRDGTETLTFSDGTDGKIELSGNNDGNAKNLKACTGECDNDGQCAAGLKCFQRSQGEDILGCKGPGKGKNWDYCYDPNFATPDSEWPIYKKEYASAGNAKFSLKKGTNAAVFVLASGDSDKQCDWTVDGQTYRSIYMGGKTDSDKYTGIKSIDGKRVVPGVMSMWVRNKDATATKASTSMSASDKQELSWSVGSTSSNSNPPRVEIKNLNKFAKDIMNTGNDYDNGFDEFTFAYHFKAPKSPKAQTPISYANAKHNNAFLVYNVDKIQPYRGNGQGTVGSGFADGQWHSMCMTWKKSMKRIEVWVDGSKRSMQNPGSGSYVQKLMGSGGTLVLGQEQDRQGASFDKNQAFEGSLTRVNVYGKYGGEAECGSSGKWLEPGAKGNVVSWEKIMEQVNKKTDCTSAVDGRVCTYNMKNKVSVEASSEIDPSTVSSSDTIKLGEHNEAGSISLDQTHLTIEHADKPGTKFHVTHLSVINGVKPCTGLILQRMNDQGAFVEVAKFNDLGKAGETTELGGEFGVATEATATQWRLVPLESTGRKFCEISRISVYGAIQDKPVAVWHGQFTTKNIDELFDECSRLGETECAGIAQETDSNNPKGALVAKWIASTAVSTAASAVQATTTLWKLEMDGTYNVDDNQRGMGLRLGDCKQGEYVSEIAMPYVGDWDFKITTKADTSKGSFASDWMDIYIRPDGTDKFVLVGRHLNDADHYSPIRISNSGRFGLKIISSSSTESMSKHMRIERSPIARNEVNGYHKLTYRLGDNPCIEHFSNHVNTPQLESAFPTSGTTDTKHALSGSNAGTHAAFCPMALFRMNKWTGQLSVRHMNVLDVRKAKNFVLNVITTDPAGLEDSTTMAITVLESNDVPEMYSFVIHVDENQKSIELNDISSLGENHFVNIGTWTTNVDGTDYPGVVGYVGSISDVNKGQILEYSIAAGNLGTSFTIHSHTGVISLSGSATLNFESESVVQLAILATDDGIGPMAMSNITTIYVHDVNERPWFPDTTRYIKENSKAGTTVGLPVQGRDVDAGDVLAYSFVQGPEELAIDSVTGQITTTAKPTLDYERQSSYDVTVKVCDLKRPCGRLQKICPSLCNTGMVTVIVVDINDVPKIVKGQVKLIDENSKAEAVVDTVVVATDEDGQAEWRDLEYSIVSDSAPVCSGLDSQGFVSSWLVLGNDEQGAFTYDQVQLKSKKEMDTSSFVEGLEPSMVPAVGVTTNGRTWSLYKDNCAMTSTCNNGCNTKGIDLSCHFHGKGSAGAVCKPGAQKCENDQAYAATYLVSNKARTVELRLSSNDGHMVWFNGELVASKFTGKCFDSSIDQAVKVSLKKGINRVLVKTMDLGGSWGFALSLSNAAGVYATTTSTGEKAGAGGFSGAAFTIESKTGQLRVKAMEALNFEMVREFTIRVRVSSLTLFDEQDVVIRIGDVNERPRFAVSEMREVPENSKPGVLVGNPISAAEVDASQRLTYWMTGQTRRFEVDGQTGQISVVSGAILDFEGVNTFMVVVYVKDSAEPPLTHQVPVNIRVTDINEAPLVRDVTLTVTEDKYPAQQFRLFKTGEKKK